MDFHCEVSADGILLRLGEHQGSYPAWWKQIRIEIYGWSPRERTAHLNGRSTDVRMDSSKSRVTITLPDDGRGEVLELK